MSTDENKKIGFIGPWACKVGDYPPVDMVVDESRCDAFQTNAILLNPPAFDGDDLYMITMHQKSRYFHNSPPPQKKRRKPNVDTRAKAKANRKKKSR